MSKLYIDGKLVDSPITTFVALAKISAALDWDYDRLHLTGDCRTLPTYFCPHCAREALRGVDVSDPSGWRGK